MSSSNDEASEKKPQRRKSLLNSLIGSKKQVQEGVCSWQFDIEMPDQIHKSKSKRKERSMRPGIRPAAKSIIAAQRIMQMAGSDWHPLLSKPVSLTLHTIDRMILEWDTIPGVLEAGQCELLKYPQVQSLDASGGEMAAADQTGLEMMIEQLVAHPQHGQTVEELRDVSGAGVIHCLVLANSLDSLDLAMRLFHKRPTLLKCTHTGGRGELGGVFDGEGSLHILAVNKREEQFVELVKLARREFSDADFEELLLQRCTGSFFNTNVPELGATPLAYAAAYSLSGVFEALFVTHDGMLTPTGCEGGMLSPEQRNLLLNGEAPRQIAGQDDRPGRKPALDASHRGERHGYYPLHAAVACGTKAIYDMLVGKCDALSLDRDNCPKTAVGQLTPLQLAAKLGRKQMFKHILRKRSEEVWIWGDEAEYRIPVDEIDSAGSRGQATVMELLVHPDSEKAAQEFLLDDFMNGMQYPSSSAPACLLPRSPAHCARRPFYSHPAGRPHRCLRLPLRAVRRQVGADELARGQEVGTEEHLPLPHRPRRHSRDTHLAHRRAFNPNARRRSQLPCHRASA